MSEPKLFQFPSAEPTLSNAERERLLKVARLREKVAKSAASERSARLLADFEQQLASTYRFDSNDIWLQAVKAADEACDIAAKAVDEECERLGIPKRFRPRLGGVQWYGRGENAVRERRVELRKVAQTRIAAIEKHPGRKSRGFPARCKLNSSRTACQTMRGNCSKTWSTR